jgi:hypothetical protein
MFRVASPFRGASKLPLLAFYNITLENSSVVIGDIAPAFTTQAISSECPAIALLECYSGVKL